MCVTNPTPLHTIKDELLIVRVLIHFRGPSNQQRIWYIVVVKVCGMDGYTEEGT